MRRMGNGLRGPRQPVGPYRPEPEEEVARRAMETLTIISRRRRTRRAENRRLPTLGMPRFARANDELRRSREPQDRISIRIGMLTVA